MVSDGGFVERARAPVKLRLGLHRMMSALC